VLTGRGKYGQLFLFHDGGHISVFGVLVLFGDWGELLRIKVEGQEL
jgi:hypothetical protein